ncbi:glycosyltransferase family 2 protein [Erythrobacter sp. HL-111]|uniref:glycosyltransferase family 2 protein n=1 Tax=Erythrobacter sp. HL-111 TaxID=1798193 RepID=UPI00087CD822|nr:glycosyltransferase family 2 protein [Erythrobacter sp. HL-111]SDS66255.1 Glycosyltransferase involved in cell wall bisynthesis [Erythrobacter sp. HL-111]
MGSIPISVVIPVRNEEANLGQCLQRLGCFDEVIVVDSGSTDATCQIAANHGATVIQFEWNGRYPKKRNWVLLNQRLQNEWVLFLDADELVTEMFCNEVGAALAEDRFDAFWLKYTNFFLGQPLKHGDPQRKLALFKIGRGLYERIDEEAWSGLDMEVHEHPVIEGDVGEITAPIDHRDDRGVAKFIQRHKDYALWEAQRTRQLRSSGREVWAQLTDRQKNKYRNIDKWWFAWAYFAWTYVVKRGFLDGLPGFSYAFYKLWYFWTIRLLLKESENREVPASAS